MTPSFIGLMATMLPGVRPSISFASLPTASTRPLTLLMATIDGSLTTMPLPLGVDAGVGGAEVDLFGFVHGRVSQFNELFSYRRMLRVADDAEARGQMNFGADIAGEAVVGDGCAHALSHLHGRMRSGLRQHHHKLVAAVAGHKIRLAHRGDQQLRHFGERETACAVAVHIVDRFKAIKVNEND
jgi:hypothetical protein